MRRLAHPVPTLLCVALAAAGTASAQSFSVVPAAPDRHDAIAIEVRYTSPCPGDGGTAEVSGTEIALFATENCGCSPFAHSENFLTLLVPPLPEGQYQVKLYAAANDEQPGCAFSPKLIGGTTLAVGPSDLQIATDPAEPQAGSPVALVLRHRCPLLFAGPAVAGGVIRVLGYEDPLGVSGPCAPEPTFESRLELGSLAAGSYTVLVLAEDLPEPRVEASETFAVAAGGAEELLLQDGRFRVTARWRRSSGQSGPGTGVPLTDDSGAFWFFRPSNLEVLLKVLDGCAVNGHFWVLASGLTNVEVELRVEDLATGVVRSYLNPLDQAFEPIQDTGALACE
jgi:hypothetical protein